MYGVYYDQYSSSFIYKTQKWPGKVIIALILFIFPNVLLMIGCPIYLQVQEKGGF